MEDIHVVGEKKWLKMVVKQTFRPVANFGDQSLFRKTKWNGIKYLQFGSAHSFEAHRDFYVSYL